MSNRGDEFMRFVPLVMNHIEEYAVKQYGDAPNDNVEKWTAEKCLDSIERYVKRRGDNNARGMKDNLLSCLKIAHYACLAYFKLLKEDSEIEEVTFPVCAECGKSDMPSLHMLAGLPYLYCTHCYKRIKAATMSEIDAIASFSKRCVKTNNVSTEVGFLQEVTVKSLSAMAAHYFCRRCKKTVVPGIRENDKHTEFYCPECSSYIKFATQKEVNKVMTALTKEG